MNEKVVITGLASIAEFVGTSKKTLYRWIVQEGFPAFKKDGAWRVLPSDVEDWFREQKTLSRAPDRSNAGHTRRIADTG